MATSLPPHIVLIAPPLASSPPPSLPPSSLPNETMHLLRIVCKNLLGKRYFLVLYGLCDANIEWYIELHMALDWQYKYGDLGNDERECRHCHH